MLSAHDSGSHSSMIRSKPVSPASGLSAVAPAGANPNAAAVSSASRMCR